MKQRTFSPRLISVVLGLLLIGVGGFYWLFVNIPLGLLKAGGTTAESEAAIFVPSSAPMMVSLLVNPQQLDAGVLLATPPKQRPQTEKYIKQLPTNLLNKAGLNYKQDVEPWLDNEITFALTNLDIDRNQNNGNQPGYLLAIKTKNVERSKQFLQVFWAAKATAGQEVVTENYKGASLLYDKEGKTWASAVVGEKFVLFANNPKVLRDAVNNVQVAGLSLKNSPSYQKSLENITQPRSIFAFVNLVQLAALNTVKIPALNAESRSLNASEILALGLSFNQQGLLSQTALVLPETKEETITPSLKEPVVALNYIPANPVAFLVAGENLSQLWQTISTQQQTGIFQLISETVKSLGESWGFNLGEDIFNWVEREYALALLPKNDQGEFNWVFVAQKSPQNQPNIERLDAIASQQGYSVGRLKIGNRLISTWTQLKASAPDNQDQSQVLAEVRCVHTSIEDYEVFASSLAVMEQALSSSDHPKAWPNQSFQSAVAALPAANDGYLYVDWQMTKPILEHQLPVFKLVSVAAEPVLENIRSLTLTPIGSAAGVRRGDALIQVGLP